MAEFTQHSIHKEMSSRRNVIINTSCPPLEIPILNSSANFIFGWVGGGGGSRGEFVEPTSTFDAEFKFVKIQNSHF